MQQCRARPALRQSASDLWAIPATVCRRDSSVAAEAGSRQPKLDQRKDKFDLGRDVLVAGRSHPRDPSSGILEDDRPSKAEVRAAN